jgi:hypothetical protein
VKIITKCYKSIKKPTWIFWEFFKGFFKLKITRKLLVLIKNGKKLHIFFIRFYYATRLENIKKVIKNLWKFIWNFLKKFYHAGGIKNMQRGANSKKQEEKTKFSRKLGPGPHIIPKRFTRRLMDRWIDPHGSDPRSKGCWTRRYRGKRCMCTHMNTQEYINKSSSQTLILHLTFSL